MRRQSDLMTALADDDAIVVHDVPLLVETGRTEPYDVIVVVDAPEACASSGSALARVGPGGAQARMDAQASRRGTAAMADEVILNEGEPDDLEEQVDALWDVSRRVVSVPRRSVHR